MRERNTTRGLEETNEDPDAQLSIEMFQGPYPPPEIVRSYYGINPTIAQTIFDLAARTHAHQLEMERAIVASDIKKSERGQILAAMFALVLVAAAFTGFLLGLPRGGVAAFGVSAVLPFLNFAFRFIRRAIGKRKD